ncbi:MAG: leader peptidase (prepilin peptidase) / N-methyltransferase [Pseudonocardiales bacterium]|nr:leader peptidase (prepilin peptidase) / N-methyltransferase [Pseudonocardiales bacterium]
MIPPVALAASAGVVGLAVGVVLNTVLYRIPNAWNQGGGTWRQYLAVEAMTAASFVALVVRFGMSAQLPAYLFLAAVGVTLAMIEFDIRRLPNSIVLPAYVISALLLMPAGAAQGDVRPAQRGLVAMAAFSLLFFSIALAYPYAVGFSDAKLAGLLGLYLGWLSWGTALLGILGSFAMVGFGGVAFVDDRRTTPRAIPIASCLILASVLALLVALPIGSWYGSILDHA